MEDLCTTPACIHLASEVLWGLAKNYTEIDPCTNFDELVCGSWAAYHEIPAGSSSTMALTAQQDDIYITVRNILEGPYPHEGWITVGLTDEQAKVDKKNFAKIQKAYDVCVDYTALAEEGLKPLAKLVKTIASDFSAACDNGDTLPYDHSDAMGKSLLLFESLGIATTQRIGPSQNDYNPNEALINILPPSSSDVPDEENLAEYVELAAALIASVHPSNITVKKAAALVQSLLVWEASVSNIVASGMESGQVTVSLAEIQAAAPQLNYQFVINQLAPEGYSADRVVVTAPTYFQNLSQIISQTPPQVLETFFIWKAIYSLSPYIESEPTNAYNNFQAKLSGDPEDLTPRWKKCIVLLDEGVSWIADDEAASSAIGPSGLTWILTRFFLEQSYSWEAKNLTSDIVTNLQASFLERIQSREWASDEVKVAAAEKLHATVKKIAWPTDPDAIDALKIGEFYENAEITSSHTHNALAMAKVNVANKWAILGKPFPKGIFISSTLTVNAFNWPGQNQMILLAGIQQFPLYDVDFPSYMLYGGMGSVVGHEITHGFDTQGRQYDATGNQTIWWDDATAERFTEKAQCFVKQYDKFTITAPNGTQVHVNGEQTINENIADAGGVVSSYAAWKKWQSTHSKAKNLPGLEKFTHEQLFFVKWGQAWCQNMSPEYALSLIETDVHSPNAARILLTLQNSVGFKEAFNCPKKEPLCELW
ncbi:hypothetical protein BGZ61DRAFT_364096 [Ilyonectria robusta]|uniref:uncharacterized protein n=1 Tax=Ilyonectria robusta TaxID=1079257 RepID=UPI001E8E1A4A|nr:uncharacterized protein BGZ61DRAFT_364096 [Ilyonectria robusta]KAH8669436.1 hypothetical protein BGZ61DRAFT_364096 [Ilyonectria robusta]